MKAYIVTTLARQLLNEAAGEFGPQTFVRVEKAYTTSARAEQYAQALSTNFKDAIQVPGSGPVLCLCERGIVEIEIEE